MTIVTHVFGILAITATCAMQNAYFTISLFKTKIYYDCHTISRVFMLYNVTSNKFVYF